MRRTKTAMIAQFRMSPESELIAITDELRYAAAVESPAFRHVQDVPLQLLHDEQDRRCIADPAAAYVLAHHAVEMDELHGRALAYDDNRFVRGLSSC